MKLLYGGREGHSFVDVIHIHQTASNEGRHPSSFDDLSLPDDRQTASSESQHPHSTILVC